MSLLKKIYIFSFIMFYSGSSYSAICVNSSSNYKMFGSALRSDVLNRAFISAFHDERIQDYKISHAENDMKFSQQINTALSESCSIVLGLFTSKDCLIAGPALLREKVVGLSSSCSTDKIKSYSPYLYTSVPELSQFSKATSNYVNSKKTEYIYIFYQPSDIYSSDAYSNFLKYTKKHVISIPVDSSGNASYSLIRKNLKNKAMIVFFTYPLPSAQILVNLDELHIINPNIYIVGASSWIFDISVFKPIKSILSKTPNVVTPSLVDQNTIDNSEFSTKYRHQFRKVPDVVEILSYDMTRFASQCYKTSIYKAKFSNVLFLNCIKSTKYNGISGQFSFQNGSTFLSRKITMINFINRII